MSCRRPTLANARQGGRTRTRQGSGERNRYVACHAARAERATSKGSGQRGVESGREQVGQ